MRSADALVGWLGGALAAVTVEPTYARTRKQHTCSPLSAVVSQNGRVTSFAQRLSLQFLSILLALSAAAAPAGNAPGAYAVGSPVVEDVWVDCSGGNDANSGATRQSALRTLTAAWTRIPEGVALSGHGYRILLTPGTCAEEAIPNYLESRWGTAAFPIIIQSADASRSARLAGDLNLFDVRYLYLIGLDLRPDPAGDVVHCEQCDHLLIRDSRLDGGNRQAHETVKVNQSRHVYIETSTLAGADDNTIDFVAVQYGHILNNVISDAQDWCVYAKGGSAYLRIEGNEVFDCGTGGITAGQGTGFQFMTSPWLHYEAYDIKIVNNVIHDTEGAGLGVNGGYNILLAHNTLYRVGSRSHMLEVTFGGRSCDGSPGDEGRDRCQQHLSAGGWGTTVVDDGTNYVRIPNRSVSVYNNVLYNPPGFDSPQIFEVPRDWTNAATQNGSNAPLPARADDQLDIRGNVIFTTSSSLGLSDDSGCRTDHPTCSPAFLVGRNTVNAFEPQLMNPSAGDFRPLAGGNLTTAGSVLIPSFTWSDAPAQPPVPAGTLENVVTTDRAGTLRVFSSSPGAYDAGSLATGPVKRRAARHSSR
jgi:hypothetical protein